MVILLLGTDQIAKKKRIQDEAEILKTDTQVFSESIPISITSLFEPQLFGANKIVVIDGLWKKFTDQELEQLYAVAEDESAVLFILEESLDKRKKINQEFLNDKRIRVEQYDSPVGFRQAEQWIAALAKAKNIKLQQPAAAQLAQNLLIDDSSTLDVLSAENELEKLKLYGAGQEITSQMVANLTHNNTGVDIFKLLNAISTKNKKLALDLLETYFATESADEKTNAIKLSALLADQFRSILIVLDASSRRLPDAQVLKLTGWKPNRLSAVKNTSKNFTVKQLQGALAKLENLDRELKTSTMPPHVVLDLIIADM